MEVSPEITKLINKKFVDGFCSLGEGEVMRENAKILSAYASGALVMTPLRFPDTSPDIVGLYRKQMVDALKDINIATRIALAVMPNKLTKTELKTAFEQLKKHDVEAIVIDLRYWKFLQKDVKDDIACNQPLMYIIEAADATKMTILIHAETDNGPFTNILEMSTWEQKACELLDIWLRIYPGLKIGVLHVTTKSMVETICRLPEQVFGLITPQHLYLTFRNFVQHPGRHTAEMIPLPKFDADRETLQAVVAHPKLGKKFCYASDSFIHRHDRACQPLCSHVYTIPLAPHMTMEVFAKSFALQNAMEDFTVKNMQRKFPNLTRSAGTFGMKKEECYVRQDNLPAIPFLTGTKLLWSIA